ncbi:MAG: hypothetical protein WC283_03320 [Candidatus Paceibacterota bacterium]|jgi:hypothetical protein
MKVNKQHIKKAVLIYEDPDTGEGRRVIFGEASEVLSLLMSQMPIVIERMERIAKKKFKNPFDFITYYLSHKEAWAKLKDIQASDDNKMELELTYEVRKI